MSDVFFIVGFVRSGTTAFARILDTASNAAVFVEQPPKLLIESRALAKGELADPVSVLRAARQAQVDEVVNQGLKYGDKSVAYMPFIPYLSALWDCKIAFLIRDGRDAVRSLMDWHRFKAHNIYAMKEDGVESGAVLPEQDPWDYSRLRPNPGAALFERWQMMSRFQKCAWYWSTFNALALDNLAKIATERWKMVDVSNSSVETVERIFDFLGLSGFDPQVVQGMLDARINSLFDRTGQADRFPRWPEWSPEQKQSFRELAGEMMTRLGYW